MSKIEMNKSIIIDKYNSSYPYVGLLYTCLDKDAGRRLDLAKAEELDEPFERNEHQYFTKLIGTNGKEICITYLEEFVSEGLYNIYKSGSKYILVREEEADVEKYPNYRSVMPIQKTVDIEKDEICLNKSDAYTFKDNATVVKLAIDLYAYAEGTPIVRLDYLDKIFKFLENGSFHLAYSDYAFTVVFISNEVEIKESSFIYGFMPSRY